MSTFFDFCKGILIGAGAILPGVSSGVLCVVFGIYDKLVDSSINFFKDWKNNLKFLFPIICGVGIGVIIFSKLLLFLFDNFFVQTKFAFIGLILGSIPILLKKATLNKASFKNLIFFFITLLISVILILLENNLATSLSNNPSVILLILAGFCMSAGVVIPGVSSTVILMIFGVYNIYLSSISSLNLAILIPMGIGLVVGSLIFLKLIEVCFKKFNSQTYFAIIGFILGSVFILFEPIRFDMSGLICIICSILGFFIANLFKGD